SASATNQTLACGSCRSTAVTHDRSIRDQHQQHATTRPATRHRRPRSAASATATCRRPAMSDDAARPAAPAIPHAARKAGRDAAAGARGALRTDITADINPLFALLRDALKPAADEAFEAASPYLPHPAPASDPAAIDAAREDAFESWWQSDMSA